MLHVELGLPLDDVVLRWVGEDRERWEGRKRDVIFCSRRPEVVQPIYSAVGVCTYRHILQMMPWFLGYEGRSAALLVYTSNSYV